MQKIAIIPTGEASRPVVLALQQQLGAHVISRTDVGSQWTATDAFIFIGAMGICVRTIAPYVADKHSDPAVVCIDSCGRHAVSVLSGHVGGANELARRVAAITGAQPVVTTLSDNAGLWALDTLAQRFDWLTAGDADMNRCVHAFVGRQPTALLIEVRDEGTDYLLHTLPEHVALISDISQADPGRYRLLIVVSPYRRQAPAGLSVLHFVPRVGVVGFGLAHEPDDYRDIYGQMTQALADHGLLPCVRKFCTIDVKRHEPFVRLLRDVHGHDVEFFTAGQLSAVDVPHPSATVEAHVGTPSVSEAAAILGAGGGRLVVTKVKGRHWTAALAFPPAALPPTAAPPPSTATPPCCRVPGDRVAGPHVEIVGAGPGAPDLISLRGQRLIAQADLILYAGSLVPRELTEGHKPGAEVRSSATMTLGEQCRLMKEHYDRGHLIVRLHTGDPSIFGAIQEQMQFFDAHAMSYHVTPGISSFLAAAAELRSQFTIPGRTQTVILTRGEGRTPMPAREQLRLLARSQSTMCIFLSAAIVDDVQQQLLEEYPATTPVAVCYHLTWPDQRIFRGVLADLARLVSDNHLTLTTMIVVGEAIGNRQGASELYSSHFTHLFRQGDDGRVPPEASPEPKP